MVKSQKQQKREQKQAHGRKQTYLLLAVGIAVIIMIYMAS